MPKVSVVIPVFGVEKFIKNCVRSLLEQTLDDIEYLFIDDCSPDKSIEILMETLEEYPHRKSQVIIHRMSKNSGQAKVREWGMKNATGEYIINCDSDDWIDLSMYEELYNFAVSNNSDLVFCDYVITDGITHIHDKIFKKNIKDLSSKGLINSLLTSCSLNPVWSVLIKKHLLEGIIYPIGAMSEDKTIMIQVAWKSKYALYLPKALYYYRLTEGSTLRTKTLDASLMKFKQILKNKEIMLNFIKCQNINPDQFRLDYFLFSGKIGYIEDYTYNKEIRKLWEESMPLPIYRIIINPYIQYKMKIKYLLVKVKNFVCFFN